MSDFEDEISDGGDFSASEDEWKPNRSENVDSSEDADSDFEDMQSPRPSHIKSNQHKRKSAAQKPSPQPSLKRRKLVKRSIQSLRSKMFNKYKPPPKTSPKILNKTLAEQLEASQYKKRKCLSSSRSESSESSVNDHLVNPKDINLMSSFFDVPNKSVTKNSEEPPNFDCNVGIRLSDSEDDNEKGTKRDTPTTSSKALAMIKNESRNKNLIASCSNDQETAETTQYEFNNLKTIEQYEKAKEHLMSYEKKTVKTVTKHDGDTEILKLLAIGEKSSSPAVGSSSKNDLKKHKHDSDSDWEDVQDKDEQQHKSFMQKYKDGIEITVELPQYQKRNDKRNSDDIEASLKRRINRVIKENQLNFHKVSLLCHIAHGIHCNKILNNPQLMSLALRLLPNKNCYPSGRTEIKYFESLIKWYKTAMQLKYDGMYCEFRKRPKLLQSLALQIKYKAAICKKDFVLIFITLLRAMGIQCRLIMNLVTLPIRPSQNDLCSLKQKKSPNSTTTKSNPKKLKKKQGHNDDSSTSDDAFSDDDDDDKKKPPKHKPQTKKESVSSTVDGAKKKTTITNKKSTTTSNNEKTEGKRIHLEKLKDVSGSDRKSDQKKPKTKINLDKLKTVDNAGVKTNGNVEDSRDWPTKPKRENPKIKVTNEEKSLPDKKVKTKQKENKIVIKLQENERITRSKSHRPSLVGDKKDIEVQIKKERKSKSKSPLPDDKKTFIRLDLGKSRRTKKEIDDTAATQQQKKPSGRSKSKTNENSSEAPVPSTSTGVTSSRPKRQVKNKNQSNGNKVAKETLSIPQVDGADDDATKRSKKRPASSKNDDNQDKHRRKQVNLKKLQVPESRQNSPSSSDSDDEFVPAPPKISRKSSSLSSKLLERVKRIDRRVLSTDDDDEDKNKRSKKNYDVNDDDNDNDEKMRNKKKMDIWVEVYSEVEEKWVTIDLFKSKVHCVDSIRKSATSPVAYVFAWNNNNTLKDVSARYCPQWNTTTRKLRVDQEWLNEAIENYVGKKTSRDIAEDRELYRMHLEKPLPTTISEYKNHPLYALKRHLLKFEAIYPPDALTLGFIRGEPVYARECVHLCHSREIWLKEARVVKPGQSPYKIVTARPKWDRMTQSVIKDLPLEIFGYWQTMQYDPPTAENGIVPRNAYGNVELFKKCMLPKKTVHLQLPQLNKVCKKLNIDCAPAVIGFDFHQGSCHPLYDGFVICEEFKDQVIEAWHKQQEEAEKKEEEKYLQRVYVTLRAHI